MLVFFRAAGVRIANETRGEFVTIITFTILIQPAVLWNGSLAFSLLVFLASLFLFFVPEFSSFFSRTQMPKFWNDFSQFIIDSYCKSLILGRFRCAHYSFFKPSKILVNVKRAIRRTQTLLVLRRHSHVFDLFSSKTKTCLYCGHHLVVRGNRILWKDVKRIWKNKGIREATASWNVAFLWVLHILVQNPLPTSLSNVYRLHHAPV